jgi:hypothetical protein
MLYIRQNSFLYNRQAQHQSTMRIWSVLAFETIQQLIVGVNHKNISSKRDRCTVTGSQYSKASDRRGRADRSEQSGPRHLIGSHGARFGRMTLTLHHPLVYVLLGAFKLTFGIHARCARQAHLMDQIEEQCRRTLASLDLRDRYT